MPRLVQFGAGNIGRGFLAPLAAAGGWRITFVDVDAVRIAAVCQRGCYRVHEVDGASTVTHTVAGVDGILAGDTAAVTAAVADADLIGTAVGLGVLPRLGPVLAAGWRARRAARGTPLDILVCENGAQAATLLREAILSALPAEERAPAAASVGVVRTSIGRMIPPSPPGADALDIAVEPYACLPVERAAFRGPVPAIPHLEAREDFDLVLAQKLYLHNATHACLAYAGAAAGLATIADCVTDATLRAGALAAGREAAEGIARAFGTEEAARERIRAENRALVDDLFRRYANRALADSVARVARDPLRKLALDDRLVGTARLCLAHGVTPTALAAHIRLACRYHAAPDEPQAEAWNAAVARSPLAALRLATALDPKDPLMALVQNASDPARAPDANAQRRARAAATIRASGMVLTPAEEQALEIADFGLGRFEQFGLAILVYVNTDRCCAKELVMLPGQICPEHRHPPIEEAREPGKEETFRVRAGHVSLFLPGPADAAMRAAALALLPEDKRSTVTVFRRVDLAPGSQCTLPPNTPHWFVAGPQGAVVSEFSTRSRDEADIFTDHAIRRVPVAP